MHPSQLNLGADKRTGVCLSMRLSIPYFQGVYGYIIKESICNHDPGKQPEVTCALIVTEKAASRNIIINEGIENITGKNGEEEERHNCTLHSFGCLREGIFQTGY